MGRGVDNVRDTNMEDDEAIEDVEEKELDEGEKLKQYAEAKLILAQASFDRLQAQKEAMDRLLEEREREKVEMNSRVKEKQGEESELAEQIEMLKARVRVLNADQQNKVTELKVKVIADQVNLLEINGSQDEEQELVAMRKKLVEIKQKNELILGSLKEEVEVSWEMKGQGVKEGQEEEQKHRKRKKGKRRKC